MLYAHNWSNYIPRNEAAALDSTIATVRAGATPASQNAAENHMRDNIYKLFDKRYAGTYGVTFAFANAVGSTYRTGTIGNPGVTSYFSRIDVAGSGVLGMEDSTNLWTTHCVNYTASTPGFVTPPPTAELAIDCTHNEIHKIPIEIPKDLNMKISTRAPKFTGKLLAHTLAWSGILATLPAQAGLFDKLTGADKPVRLELTESTDRAATFIKAFSDSGALARDIKPADFVERKIVISGFQINFATEQVGYATAAGIGSTSVEKVYTLQDVPLERLQSLTDSAYAAFADILKKRGYDVLPQSALEAASFKSAMIEANQPPVKWERSGLSKMAGGGNQNKLDNDNVNFTATAKGTSPAIGGLDFKPAAMTLADELGAAVIQVRLKINFARFDDSGMYGYSEIDDKPQNMLGAKSTLVQIFSPGTKRADFTQKKSLLLPHRAAEKATAVAMTTAEKAGTTAMTAMSVFGGFLKGGLAGAASEAGGAAHSIGGSGKFEVKADANYETNTSQDIALALEVIAEALPK